MLRRERFAGTVRWKKAKCICGKKQTARGSRVFKETLRAVLPAMAEMGLNSLTSAADTLMLGREAGPEALAAFGLTAQPRLLLLCPFFALSTAVTAAVAKSRGDGESPAAGQILRAAMLLALGLSLALSGGALFFADPLLRFSGGSRAESEAIFHQAQEAFRITAVFLPAHALGLCVCAAHRGLGHMKTALWINGASNLIDLLLNAVLIGGRLGFPRMELRGAAIASAAARTAALLLSLITAAFCGGKNGDLRGLFRFSCQIDRQSIRTLYPVMKSAAAEQLSLRTGYFLAGRSLFSLGTVRYAALQIGAQWQNLTFSLGDGLSSAAMMLMGKRLGEGNKREAARYGRLCFRCGWVLSAAVGAVILLFHGGMGALFVKPGDTRADITAAAASDVLLALSGTQLFQIGAAALNGCLRAAGENRFVTAVTFLCVSVIRPVLTAWAVGGENLELPAIWLLGSAEAALRCLLFYGRIKRWEKQPGSIRVIQQRTE